MNQAFFAVSSVASVALEAEIDDCHQRLLSGEITMITADPGSWKNSTREIATRPFTEAFDNELRRLECVLMNHRNTIDSSAEALLKDADGLSRRKEHGKLSGSDLSQQIDSLRTQAQYLQTKTLKIIQEATKNQTELHRIALRADARLHTSCADDASREFSKEPWTDKGSAGHIVKLLSDIFTLIRKIEHDDDNEDKNKNNDEWVAPTSFERVTTKYWVREEDIPEVLLKSASELPVLVYGKSGLLTKNPKDPSKSKTDFWKSMASPISSVYFDSDNLDLYKERLKRSEGAQLIRVRWYGHKKPKDDSLVFVELKTHHECWIDNKSVKERVTIVQKRMNDLCDITNDEKNWSVDRCKGYVLEISECEIDPEELQSSAELLAEIRSLFVKWQLKPCVRTSYTRAAFQNPNNNNLRLTLDRDITVIDETRRSDNRASSWCIDDNDAVPIDAFIKVPYGVFEVKVASGESPVLIEDLEESECIIEAPKFSKFLTGASLHNATKLRTLPWWSDDALFAPMYKMRKEMTKREGRATRRSFRSISGSKPICDMFIDTVHSKMMIDDGEDDELSEDSFCYMEAAEEGRVQKQQRSTIVKKGMLANDEKRRAPKRPSSSTEQEDDIDKSINTGLFAIKQLSSLRLRKTKSSNMGTKAAPRTPARVEPKSFFANERTFIQWITVGSMFMFVAGLVYAEARSAGPRMGKPIMMLGNSLIGCALFVAVYGSIVYYRRLYLMINAKPYGYSDTFGPAVLATFMITLLCTFIYVYHIQFEYPNKLLVDSPGICSKRYLDLGTSSGISFLQFEPSAVVVDEERDLMIIASLDEIVAIPAKLPEDKGTDNAPMEMKILHRFPEGTEDLEALEIVDNTIYAVSENKKDGKDDQSEIIAMDWTSGGLLEETNRWRITAPNVEGMAYTNDPNWFPNPYMLVAADLRTLVLQDNLRLALTGYRFPFPSAMRLTERRLNNKFFSQKLENTKVSAMQFFGGLLYALYNNDQVIRAYDYNGNTVNEWNLPVGEAFYDKYWEGMRLQRDGNDLYLHLALDSPPQVWTIKLKGETSTNSPAGQWRLPRCAGG